MRRVKHRLTKSQLERRKKKRWAMKPIRQGVKLALSRMVALANAKGERNEMAELGTYPTRIKMATRAKKGQAY